MRISFQSLHTPESGAIILPIYEKQTLKNVIKQVDKRVQGAIVRALKTSEFSGKNGSILTLITPHKSYDFIVLLGLGAAKSLKETDIEDAGGKLLAELASKKVKQALLLLDNGVKANISDANIAALLGYGAFLRNYHFSEYHTKNKKKFSPVVTTLTIACDEHTQAKSRYQNLEKVAHGVFEARDLVTEPPNKLYPESYAKRVKTLTSLGMKVEVLGEKEMQKLGMGSLLGVGQGSVRESKLVVMRYNGAKKKDKPIAFVGKGVTFDTGGISLKPSAGMEDMKYDMGGSAAVVGVMKALAGRKAKVNAVGVIGLVENMPDGNAQRPSDVVTSMSGQTIEVLNTDAEGRLVLADALWYTQERFKPKWMINLATLTGAIIIALGNEYGGLFSNNDALSKALIKSGEASGEKLWRFPLGDAYDKMLDSPIADMQNISAGRGAGSITAGQFLQRFVNNVPWAHLDIAGMAWTKKTQATCPKGATGFGVRVLDRLVRDNYEEAS